VVSGRERVRWVVITCLLLKPTMVRSRDPRRPGVNA
jgi:hypothetical protein